MGRTLAKFVFTYRHFSAFFPHLRTGADEGEVCMAKPEKNSELSNDQGSS